MGDGGHPGDLVPLHVRDGGVGPQRVGGLGDLVGGDVDGDRAGTGEPLAAEDVDAAIEGGDHVAAAVQADDQRDRRLVHRRRDGGTARQRDATHQKTDDQYPQRSHPVTMGPARWRPRTPSVAPG
ncbi:hypothetical protein ACFQFC_19810 [Amorphoplanes digitatis]|uniref:hypothetical protein n=1 Tax=Actinoplanes digitatis TaxID=1868 RepID=UPI0036154700